MRATILRWGCAAILLAIVGSCAVAVDLAKEDIDFRKEVYVDKKGDKLPYRLFVPIGYSSANTYLQRSTVEFPAFVLAPQGAVGENWSDPEFNRSTNALQRALEILASVEKQFAIDPERIDVVGQSMGGLGVWSLLQTHSEKWAAAVVLAAYDNFTAPMSISRIPLWVFQGDAAAARETGRRPSWHWRGSRESLR